MAFTNSGSRELQQQQCAMYMPSPAGRSVIMYCNLLLICEVRIYHRVVGEDSDILGR